MYDSRGFVDSTRYKLPVTGLGPLLLRDEHEVADEQLELVRLPGHVGVENLVDGVAARGAAVVAVEAQLPAAGAPRLDVARKLLQRAEVLLGELVGQGQVE